MLEKLAALAATFLFAASTAYAQAGSAVNKDGTKPRPDPQPFYTPYTGPGFGNPDANATQSEPVGKSRRKYHDATGTSAYSRGGNNDPTQLTPPPSGKKKKEKPKTGTTDVAPAPGEKR